MQTDQSLHREEEYWPLASPRGCGEPTWNQFIAAVICRCPRLPAVVTVVAEEILLRVVVVRRRPLARRQAALLAQRI